MKNEVSLEEFPVVGKGIIVTWGRTGERQYWRIRVQTEKPFTPEAYSALGIYIIKNNEEVKHAEGYYNISAYRMNESSQEYIVDPPQYPSQLFVFYALGTWTEFQRLAKKIRTMYEKNTMLKPPKSFFD